jgi:hypothetical protein
MREDKVESLGKEIEMLAQNHERDVVRKNRNLESIDELRINLKNKIKDLEKQFDENWWTSWPSRRRSCD